MRTRQAARHHALAKPRVREEHRSPARLMAAIRAQRELEKQRRCHKLIGVPFRIMPRAPRFSGLCGFDILASAEAAQ
jgi:hypothetical protein